MSARAFRLQGGSCRRKTRAGRPRLHSHTTDSLCINLQIDVYLGRVSNWLTVLVSLLRSLILGVDFVVDVGRERREPVHAILAHDESLHRAGAGIGEINDSTGKRRVLLVDDSSRQQTASIALLSLATDGRLANARPTRSDR